MRRIYEQEAYRPEVGSWWQETESPPVWPRLDGDRAAQTVIIGAGYTGLNCALELAETGADPASITLLDARQPGWGASGRNGGFACMGGSKLGYAGHVKRFGEAETLNYYREQMASVESVRENLARYSIDADIHSDGETLCAHRAGQVDGLMAEKAAMREQLGIEAQFIEGKALAGHGLASPEFHAALTTPVGFALNPMKYVAGLARAAGAAGIAAFGDTPALELRREGNRWKIATPGGMVSATNLVIATNGYSSEDVPGWLAGRLLPVLTNIMVTRPLSAAELADQGWTSHQMCYDTRTSLHYFHLLPAAAGEDGPRMLFGMRGGTNASQASQMAMKKRIRRDFDRFFPAWQGVETTHFWSGLACLSRDLTSFTGPLPELENAWASLAYHGNGVAMGSHCGRLVGRMIAGSISPASLPPAMRAQLRRFPFAPLRRTYLRAAYAVHEFLDT